MSTEFEALMDLFRRDADLFVIHARMCLRATVLAGGEASRIRKMLPSTLPAPKNLAEQNQRLYDLVFQFMKLILRSTRPKCFERRSPRVLASRLIA